jgi:F-type H+-transporting ATPase subunit b
MILTAETASKIVEFSFTTVWDFCIQLLSLFVIVIIFKTLLFKPVLNFIDTRKEAISKELVDAEKAQKEAQKLKNAYESKMNNVEAEASEILKAARAKALMREEQIIAEAKEEAKGIKQKAEADIKLEQERVKAEMKNEMIDVAAVMASKFVETNITQDKQDALVDEVIKEMGDVQWLN